MRNKENFSYKQAFLLNGRAFQILNKKYPLLFVSSAIYALLSALTPYVEIYLSAQIINELAGERNPERLTRFIAAALLSAVVLSLVNAVLLRWKNCKHSLLYYKRAKIYTDKLLDMDFCSLDDQHTHDLKSQNDQNEQWSGWGLGRVIEYFETCVNSLTRILGAVALTVSLFTLQVPAEAGRFTLLNNPLFAMLIILIMIAVTVLSPIISNKANSYWARNSDDAKLGNRFFGFFGFMANDRYRATDIRMYNQERICQHYSFKIKTFTPGSRISIYARGPMGILNAASSVISTAFTGIVYVFVCLKAWAGAFGVGSVTQYIGAITALSTGFASLIGTMGNMRHNATFLATSFEFLDIPNDMYQGSLSTEKRSDRKYEVEFRNVSFRYPNAKSEVLKNVSLKFNIGQRLAVVGQNGSGKTTFIKLLCRLYDPTEGEILLNGIDIRKYNYQDYLSIFSVVFQDFKLLSFGLGQNVSARVDFDQKRAEECLIEAGFGDRLKEMPKGVETSIYKDFDEEGVEISGGEAQKIALARALYKNAPFIVLDEPTAALDPIAEFEIYSKFNEMVGDKTAIYISHRLSSCRFCDDIAVFHEGKLIQQGSHDCLIGDKNGKYYELWNAQAQYYSERAV